MQVFTVVALAALFAVSCAHLEVMQKVQNAIPNCIMKYNPMKQFAKIQKSIKANGIDGIKSALENPDETVTCFSKCMMQEIGLMDKNGKINQDEAKKLMDAGEKLVGNFGGGQIMKLLREGMKSCTKQEWKDTAQGKCSGVLSFVKCIAEKILPVLQNQLGSGLGGFMG